MARQSIKSIRQSLMLRGTTANIKGVADFIANRVR